MSLTKIEWTWQRVAIGSIDSEVYRHALEIGAVQVDAATLLVPGFTFNPWIGCTKVDDLCAHCYAEAQDKFRSWTPQGWGPGKPRRRTSDANWRKVLAWDELANQLGIRLRVFCASLADWLDDDGVPIEWLADLLQTIDSTPGLDWLLLTKRPENFRARLEAAAAWGRDHEWDVFFIQEWLAGLTPKNVWVGTSVGHQKSADTRIPLLLQIPARVRFLSCEPMLGPVDLASAIWNHASKRTIDQFCEMVDEKTAATSVLPGINWVICGGESGVHARPMHPDWARSLRDQCAAAGVPFLFKQWGEWAPGGPVENPKVLTFQGPMMRCGKKAAGRLLDGIEHNGSPEVRT